MENYKNRKDTTKHKVMSELLEDRIVIESRENWLIIPSNEHINLHYYKDGKPKGFMISFNQVIEILNQKLEKS